MALATADGRVTDNVPQIDELREFWRSHCTPEVRQYCEQKLAAQTAGAAEAN
jgi:hypothetical protein